RRRRLAVRFQRTLPVFLSRQINSNLCSGCAALSPSEPAWRGRGGSVAAGTVGTAVVRKILSPQTTGEEWPRPGIVAFHLVFSVSLQRSGASVRAIPSSDGPLHLGHWPGSAAGS